jgi:hypothetical protein
MLPSEIITNQQMFSTTTSIVAQDAVQKVVKATSDYEHLKEYARYTANAVKFANADMDKLMILIHDYDYFQSDIEENATILQKAIKIAKATRTGKSIKTIKITKKDLSNAVMNIEYITESGQKIIKLTQEATYEIAMNAFRKASSRSRINTDLIQDIGQNICECKSSAKLAQKAVKFAYKILKCAIREAHVTQENTNIDNVIDVDL